MDTLPEQAYDDFTRLASMVCDTPIALITLIDEDRQWFKSRVGMEGPEIPRQLSFCNYTIVQPDKPMIVTDTTQDERFADHPFVTSEASVRFYAGVALTTPTGEALGTICVIDRQPRELTQEQENALIILSREIMVQFELRRSIALLEQSILDKQRIVDQLQDYQLELEKARQEIERQALTDPLTGVGNRRAFDIELAEEFERARRYYADCSLIMIDVDNFKQYNDMFGHPAGDQALIAVANLLKSGTRTNDILTRYGGEEFAVILPNTNLNGAMVMGERFRRDIQQASWIDSKITISVGVACSQDGFQTFAELLKASDQALYQAKQSGKNRVVVNQTGNYALR